LIWRQVRDQGEGVHYPFDGFFHLTLPKMANAAQELLFRATVYLEKGVTMDRCPKCKKRMKPVLSQDGRTDFKCLTCNEMSSIRLKRTL
jgi:tRNA(Ile2) C34 agmatinyltransferase TiaS